MDLEYKTYPSKVDSVEDGRTVTGIAAVIGVVDAGRDVIFKGAFRKTLQEGGRRVKHLWQHDMSQPPIATILEIKEVGLSELPADLKAMYPDAKGGLLVKRRYLDTPRANEVLAGLLSDPPAITEMSFGYDTIKAEPVEMEVDGVGKVAVRALREIRLWDTSDVNWGMNEATVARVKSALPFRDYGVADIDAEWSRPSLEDFLDEPKDFSELSLAAKRRIAAHFAWTANNPPESFGDLKLPHHAPSKDGVGKAVWAGVRAAMNALLGGRGGVDIPADEREAVYRHLVGHYKQFDKEPPDFKVASALWSLGDAKSYLLEMENTSDSKAVLLIDEILGNLKAEPEQAKAALLTLQKAKEDELRLRMALRQRELEIARMAAGF